MVSKHGEWPEFDKRFEIEIPFTSPVFKAVYSGSACYLLVPEDLKEKAKQKAKELNGINIIKD